MPRGVINLSRNASNSGLKYEPIRIHSLSTSPRQQRSITFDHLTYYNKHTRIIL